MEPRLYWGDEDEEYGSDEPTDITDAMKVAGLAFAKVIREEHVPYTLKKTGKKIEINVKEWRAENPR